jgi:hypothetical protein
MNHPTAHNRAALDHAKLPQSRITVVTSYVISEQESASVRPQFVS